ncbi:MAG: T9SS C-terminal target domain-containing protein [Chitinophagia bacterium]|nr:T9SS C-terminal target domain-containing protein [Chitinophagia bacterium]
MWHKNTLPAGTAPTLSYTKGTGTDTITVTLVSVERGCYDSVLSAVHYVGEVLSVATMGNSSLLKVSPNPAGNTVHISLDKAMITHLSLTDITGREVFQSQPNAPATDVDITQLPAGIYLIKVNHVWVTKWIKY